MLKKLIKYEFTASGRILLPLYGAMIIFGFISALFLKIPQSSLDDMKFIGVVSVITIVMYVVLIFSSFVLSFIIAIYRFKKNLFDSEGYLMNTLPVTASQNIISKLVVAVAYQILGVIAAGISGLIYIIMFYNQAQIDWKSAWDEISLFMAQFGGTFIIYMIESIILAILCLFSVNLSVYSAISIGHIANDKKVFKSVLAFIGMYICTQIINFLLIKIGTTLFNLEFETIQSGELCMGLLIVLEALYCVAYFSISRHFVKNKLNLQ